MAYKELTNYGKDFILANANYFTKKVSDNALLQGNNGALPFSSVETDTGITWTAHVTNQNGKTITNNTELANYLILLFNKYSNIYDLDANIIAAQAYEESRYRVWTYAPNSGYISTASGIAQITMNTLYDIIYTYKFLTNTEVAKITNGMEYPERGGSWRKVLDDDKQNSSYITRQKKNRTILHQNMINNPDIIIKAQCALMNFIADRNNNLASSTLFAYSRGSSLQSNNYIQIINTVSKKNSDSYTNDGLNYVEHIFGYLGDKEHIYVTGLDKTIIKHWFGYDNIDFTFNDFQSDAVSNYSPDQSTKDPEVLIEVLRVAFKNAQNIFNIKYSNQYYVVPNSIYRTPAHQYELYKVGRDSHGNIIGDTLTPLDGYNKISDHNTYPTKAFDFAIYTTQSVYVNGKANETNRALYQEFADLVIGNNNSIVWGGNFKNQPNDVVHIQLNS